MNLDDPPSWALIPHKEVMVLYCLTFMQVSINFIQIVLVVDILMRPMRESGTHLLKGNHYLRLRNSIQTQTRLVIDSPKKDVYLKEFVWVSSNLEFQAGDDGLYSFPQHNSRIPDSKFPCNFSTRYFSFDSLVYL